MPQGELLNIPQKRSSDQRAHIIPVEYEQSQLKGSRSPNSHTVSTCRTLCLLGVLDFIMIQFGYINIFIAGGWTSLLTLLAMQMTVVSASGYQGQIWNVNTDLTKKRT